MAPLTGGERKTFLDFLTRVAEGNRNYVRPGKGRRRPRQKRSLFAVGWASMFAARSLFCCAALVRSHLAGKF